MQATTTQASKSVLPKKPKMGGLIDAQDRKEAWTGGKPNSSLTGLNCRAPQIPIASQLCSNNSKAAVAMIKHTKDCTPRNQQSLNIMEILISSASCLKNIYRNTDSIVFHTNIIPPIQLRCFYCSLTIQSFQ